MSFENYINNTPKITETSETNEDLPQENEKREKGENIKTFDITIDGQQYSLRAKKNVFSYPENIEKETGIKGYERLVVDKEQIFDLLNNAWKNRFGKALTDLGVSDLDKMEDIYNSYSLVALMEKEGYDYTKDPDWDELEYKNKSIFMRSIVNKYFLDIPRNIQRTLSDNNFPDNSFLFDASNDDGSGSILKEDKFFLQKIFGMESYNKFKAKTGDKLFGKSGNPEVPKFLTIDKETYKTRKFDNNYVGRTSEEISQEYEDSIKKNDVFYVADQGLNISEKDFFWRRVHLFSTTPAIGFYLDGYLTDYILKSIDEYRKINNANEKPVIDGKIVARFGTRKFLRLFGMLETVTDKSYKFDRYSIDTIDEMFYDETGDIDKISHLLNKYGGRFNKDEKAKDYITLKNNEVNSRQKFEVADNWTNGRDFSRHIPIFINNDDIPQLRWGAAKYCSFYNKKGFNFIKIEHDDKYPGKNKSENN